MRYNIFKIIGFSDPDGDNITFSEWQISTDSGFSQDKIILDKILPIGSIGIGIITPEFIFTMSETIFLPNKSYFIRATLEDSTGLLSAWSDSVNFTTVPADPDDADDNGIDDSYQASGNADTNNNGVNDSSKGILALSDAQGGKTVGVTSDKGSLRRLTSLSTSDVFDTNLHNDPMPYGLFSYRIDGLSTGEMVNVTFYFPDDKPSDAKWYKFNSVDRALVDYTANAIINEKKITLSIADGGTGDADCVANGIIIDPSGPAFVEETPNTTPDTTPDTNPNADDNE